MNELHQLAYGEVRTQRKLRACGALVTALDNISDAVEITNETHVIQVMNGRVFRHADHACVF